MKPNANAYWFGVKQLATYIS